MAGVTLGFLKYVLGLDTLNFRKGISQADADLAKMQKGFAAKGRQLQDLGKSMTAFVTLPLAAIGAKSIQAAKEVQLAAAQVKSALASMGPVAGRSFDQLAAQADKLQRSSLFDDDDILKSVTANMLTFGNVSGEAFDRAQQAAINLSARLGQDLQSSAIQVGKALNDPIKGVTALRRVGVQLTQQQQDQVKAMVAVGNVAGAQRIILGELEREFGGAAKAQRDATPDADLQLAWRNFTETIGKFAIEVLPPLTAGLSAVLSAFNQLSPGVQGAAVAIAAVALATGPVLIALGNLMKLFALSKTIVLFGQGLTGLALAEGAAATGTVALGVAARGLLVAIGPLALAVTGVYLAWKNWDKIKPIVESTVTAVANRIRGNLYPQLDDLKSKLNTVGDAFKHLYDRVVGHSYIPDMVTEIGQHMDRLDGLMVQPAKKATAAAAEAFAKLKEQVSQLLDQLFPEEAQSRQQVADLKTLDDAYKAHILTVDRLVEARAKLFGTPGPFNVDIPGGDQPLATGTVPDLDALTAALPKFEAIVDKTQQWKDALADVGKQLASLIGDDLARIVEGTAKLKDLWKDLLGFAIRFLTSDSGIGKLFGGARAAGGPVMANTPYLVGERGPEIFLPSGGGRIVSNDNSRRLAASAGMGGASVQMTVYATDADSFRRSDRQVVRSLQRRLR